MTEHDCPTCNASRAMRSIKKAIEVIDAAHDAWLDQGADMEGEMRYAKDALTEIYANGIAFPNENIRLWTREWGEQYRTLIARPPVCLITPCVSVIGHHPDCPLHDPDRPETVGIG